MGVFFYYNHNKEPPKNPLLIIKAPTICASGIGFVGLRVQSLGFRGGFSHLLPVLKVEVARADVRDTLQVSTEETWDAATAATPSTVAAIVATSAVAVAVATVVAEVLYYCHCCIHSDFAATVISLVLLVAISFSVAR